MGFAFYAYSSGKYQLSIFGLGQFFGPPEDAFEVSENVHLWCGLPSVERRDCVVSEVVAAHLNLCLHSTGAR